MEPDSSRIQIVTGAKYQGQTDTIKILLQPSLFSKFAYYSNVDPSSIVWANGDTVWGPYHTNGKIYVGGNPVFEGKTTAFQGVSLSSKSDKPQFNGGFQSGVSITMPTDLSLVQSKAQQAGGGFYLATTNDFYLTFNKNGTVTYRNGTAGAWTTAPLTTFAGTNKVIVVNGGNIRIKGVVSGQVTIAAMSSTNSSNIATAKGQVFLDSSVVYNDNPIADPSSTDMLGICASNSIVITDSANNNNPANGINIQASLFSLNQGLTAQDYVPNQ